MESTRCPRHSQALPLEDEIRNLIRIMWGDQSSSSTGTDSWKWLGENKMLSGNERVKARTVSKAAGSFEMVLI